MKKKTLIFFICVLIVAFSFAVVLSGGDRGVLPADAVADKIVVEKNHHEMTLFYKDKPLKTYRISLGRGGLGPKERQGDNKTPEGVYRITGHNPNSAFHLSLQISYPESRDIARASAKGENSGGDIMIHGMRNGFGWIGGLHRIIDWTAGCIAVTDKQIEEIARVVPDGTAVEIKP